MTVTKRSLMPRDIEQIVATHQLAAERRAAGKPIWDRKITIYLAGRDTFEQRRDAWATALKNSTWTSDDSILKSLIDDLADAENAEEFDFTLDEIYDLADADRVWITVKR
jgi:hypothetical protein